MELAQLTQIMGLFGAILYVAAFLLLQLGIFKGSSISYILINLFAASLTAISVINAFNYSALISSICWILISIIGLFRIYRIRRSVNLLTDDERFFIESKLADLSNGQVVELLKSGLWINGEDGVELTRQNEINQSLFYLADGSADVLVDGNVISAVSPDSFIGEVTCLSGDPASATVRLTKTSRYLSINAEAVRKLVKKDVNLKQLLELSFASDMRDKLISTNRKVLNPVPETLI